MTIKVTYNVTDVYMSQSVSPVYINVSYSDGGASGGGVWGSITGTLSNQTDLQTALDLKLDESTIDGGTEGQILSKASATDFDFAWINNYAKYLATNVRNQTGSTIGAFQVVYISGATGNKPLISLADADTEATSSKTYGVTATAIANNGTGDVVTAGELIGIDTSAFNEGDLLWLSTTAGGVVTTPPAEPAHAVFIGYVVRSHPTLGVIDVSIANGYELNELHGVQITTPTDNQGLFYNSTSTLWENKSITTALGYTPVPTTRNITINGVTYDLSADRTWTISTGISGSGVSGQVTYWTGASAVSGSNNLFWDNANGRLGIGTNAPTFNLSIKSSTSVSTIHNQNNSTGGQYFITAGPDSSYMTGGASFNGTNWVAQATNAVLFGTFAGDVRIYANKSLTSGNIFTPSERFTIFGSTGNVAVNSTTDLSVRFGVVGDTLLRGSGATSATTALTVQNSDSNPIFYVQNNGGTFVQGRGASNVFFVLSSAGSNLFYVQNAGVIGFTAYTWTPESTAAAVSLTASSSRSWNIVGDKTNTTGVGSAFFVTSGFTPTSGTGVYNAQTINPTINQTGGANGITRGLYVNPTLTSAADFRAIETARGNIVFSNLPTSSAGLPTGALWNNGGVINIV